VAIVLAVEQRRDEQADRLVALAIETEGGRRDLRAALAWVPPRSIEVWAEAFAGRGESQCAAALLASHVHRLRSPAGVPRRLAHHDLAWRRALAYQSLGDQEGDVEAAILEPGLVDPSPEVRLAALWARTRKSPVVPPLDDFVAIAVERPDLAERTFDLAARCRPGDANKLLARLPPGEPGQRAGIRAVVASGLPSMIPWLWARLRAPKTAQLAGWAYATVSGADLRAEGLLVSAPAQRRVGPNDDPSDPTTELPPEYHALWPDTARIEADWHRRRLDDAGDRLLLGLAITRETLGSVLRSGAQPTRAHAALELSLLDRRSAVFCTRVPAFRQRAQLGL
jgi:uncharacterized protein (TIGR02270 family)